MEHYCVLLFEARWLGERVKNGEKLGERFGRILGHRSRFGGVLVEHPVVLWRLEGDYEQVRSRLASNP